MVKVYFESGIHAELVAVFDTDENYNSCLPVLKALAKESRMIVTESVVDEVDIADLDEITNKMQENAVNTAKNEENERKNEENERKNEL